MDLGSWLRSLGLEQYEAVFRENAIDADLLHDLTEDHLCEMGLPLGARLKLRKAISELVPRPEPISPAPVAPSGLPADTAERRQVTIMFSDLVGSTALAVRMDPEDLREIVSAYQKCVAETVQRYDGFVARYMGDGVLVYFGYPRAHEDDAERAVRAGLDIIAAVARLETHTAEPFAVRIGIATGLVVVGGLGRESAAHEHAAVGDTPNLAVRLERLAQPGTIVVSASTRRLLGDLFRLRDLGRHEVKGIVEPVAAWAVEGVSDSESRFEALRAARPTDLVGRRDEIDFLLERQRLAWRCEGQVVLISGEPGIGKSRLAAALSERIGEPHTRLRYQCSPYHANSALHPFIARLERAAGLKPDDPPKAKLEKLEAVLAMTTPQVKAVAPLIATLLRIPFAGRYPPLALSPVQQRRQTLVALLDRLEGLARRSPVLLMFEDTQWADATSLELLDLTVERVRQLPILALLTFRPEFEPRWADLANVTTLMLRRLERNEVENMVARLTGGRRLPAEVMKQIVSKTDGNPLFVEELTKAVLEAGILVEDDGAYRLNGPLPPLAIPATLQDSLMARLDRLAPVKEIGQIGAAIGREFSYFLLRALVGRDKTVLNDALAQLERAELVSRHGEPPEASYTFKHALVQDAAYESLLKSRRQVLHRRIAETLCDAFPQIVDAEPEIVAHHFTQAGLTEAATEWWGKAGEQALHRSAFQEAASHLGKAIEMADNAAVGSPPRTGTEAARVSHRLQLQTSYGRALMWSRGYSAEETKAAFTRAQELAAAIDNATERFTAYYGLWLGSLLRGELGMARGMAQTFISGLDHGERMTQAVARRFLGLTCFCQGDFAAARTNLETALSIHDPERDREADLRFGDTRAGAAVYLAHTSRVLGELGRARELMEQGIARAVESAHVPTLINTYYFQALFEILRGDAEAAWRVSEAIVKLSEEHGFALFFALGTLCRGWARARLGDREAGVMELRQALTAYAELGNRLYLPLFQGLLAEIEAEGEETEKALNRIDEALALSRATGERCADAFLHCINGEIIYKAVPVNTTRAEEAFLAAIAIAQIQKARCFELRAALALATLYQSIGRPAAAHAVLAPAVRGLMLTPDLPEIANAQALIDALAL
jgi:class 3 adenylate cyclase/predicted ATPase